MIKTFKEIYLSSLKEMKVNPTDFASKLQSCFENYLHINLLPDFYKILSEKIVNRLLKDDEEDEGIILINDNGIKFIDNKSNIITGSRAFAETVIATCQNIAKNWQSENLPLSKDKEKFITYFVNLSNAKDLIPEIIKAVSEAPPQSYITPPNYRNAAGYSAQ
jgi:hypothetical protein